MSAILNTLKKLEEEKSVFEQSLDVQDLALHNEFGSTSSFVQINRKRHNLILIASVSIFLIISVSLFFYFNSTQTQENQKLALNSFFDTPKNSGLKEVKLPEGASVSGISMNQISGERAKSMERAPILEQPLEADFIVEETQNVEDVSNQAKVAEVVKLISSGERLKNSSTQSLKDLEIEKSVLNDNKNSEEEIAAPNIRKEIKISKEDIKKTNEEIISLISGTQIDKTEEKVFLNSQEINPLNTPSLKLKGIIYFTEGNPANYIFVSSAEQNNVKLKVGESIMGAMLQSIQSSRAIFVKNGKAGFIEIGQ